MPKERREHLRGDKCKDCMVDLEEMYGKNKVWAHGAARLHFELIELHSYNALYFNLNKQF
jgi:hypothetical protein